MSSSKMGSSGIRSTKSNPGGVRGALRPWGHAAVGLASALVASTAVAQEPSTSPAPQTPAAAPASPDAPRAQEASPAPQTQAAPAPQSDAAPQDTSAGAEEQFTLPTIQVEGESERYKVEESSLARVRRPLVDTPQSVVVVPEKVMDQQQATTLRDALRNVSGITVSAGEGGRQGDSFSLRGFSAQTDTLRDGVRDLGWFTRDTFNLQGVEVYFGSSSVVFGRGSTGGAINLVTKKPAKTSFQELKLTLGTAPSGRFEADINQAVSDKLQVRVSGTGQLADVAQRQLVQKNRAGIAPSLRYALSDKATLEVDYLYQHEDSVPDYGEAYFRGYPLSSSLGVPRDTFFGVKGSDTERVNAHIGTGRFLYDFGEGLRLTNTLRLGGVDRFARPTAPRGLTPTENPTTIGRQRFETATDNMYLANQTDLSGVFQTSFLKHHAGIGLDLSREWRDQRRYNLNAVGLPTGPNVPADVFDPDPLPDLSAVSRVFSTSNATTAWNVGLYASDQIELSKYFEVLGSIRYDIFRTDYATVNAANLTTRLENKDKFFNWRAGAVVHPVENSSLYAMYGTSANPSAEVGTLTSGQESLDPETNATYEVGGKADVIATKLSVNAAVFRIDKKNARVPNSDPSGPPTVLDGEQRVQGFNLGLAGSPARHLNVFATYTFMDSEIRKHSNAFLVGQVLPNTPKHGLSLWTTYDIMEGFTVGGGAAYQDVTVVNNPATANDAVNKVPNFWRFDLFASYALRKVDLQLNIYNLTDALYYEQFYSGHAVPAEGRTALLSGRVRF